jgi:hypothetical protein
LRGAVACIACIAQSGCGECGTRDEQQHHGEPSGRRSIPTGTFPDASWATLQVV